jgi:hypothetical protein
VSTREINAKYINELSVFKFEFIVNRKNEAKLPTKPNEIITNGK